MNAVTPHSGARPASRRRLLLAALLVSLPVGLLHGATADGEPAPAPADPAFTIVDLEWLDKARDRPVPVRLYLPLGARGDKPVPLVVFSHGLGGSRTGY